MSAAPLPHDVAETPSLAPILAVHFLGTLGFSLAIPFLVFIVTDLGGASWTYGLLGATYSGFQLVGAPLLGRWSDRVGRRRVLVVTQLGTFTAWMLFFFALSLPVGDPLFEVWGAPFVIPLLFVFLARALDGATGGNISVANA
ncbi:MAG: MFS transporter, partial [Myxococcota bacterium]